ncbi:MAG TPA: PAS domain-containing hybrid sensor histidine kinase/response regulator [Steroidobacteraceae bacterium]|nr:PAS domain-containing hybrid sensor histidine kinase/response regulator [Steroidobacteraceae bacterium]
MRSPAAGAYSAAMVSGLLITVLAIGYLLILFAVAFFGERHSIYPGRARLRPYIYSLALGVYCTTWTFFGAVGTAVRDGWNYVPIYLGPALLFLLATPFLERLVAVVRAHNITSIADLISSRFGKSPALAALVTVIAVTAAVPYLALQYKAVGTSIAVMTGSQAAHVPPLADPALWVALLMALFAILFGTRRLDATEHHEGVMLAIAFESVVKLLAFVAVGAFALLHLKGAPPLLSTRLGVPLVTPGTTADFVATTALGAAAIFCLPRQFLVGVVECADPTDVRRARLLFSAYLAVFCLVVVPVVLAGLGAGLGASHSPDDFVLTLPLERGATGVAVLVFLGGLSAATGMVIMASIALATMITNDIVMPVLWRGRWLGLTATRGVGRLVLWMRRVTILGLALLAYTYHHLTVAPAGLASIGLLAFAAVAQFAPAILAGLYWRRATLHGVFWGLLAGYGVWVYALLLPTFGGSGMYGPGLLEHGPLGIAWLKPQGLLGLGVFSPLVRGAVLALAANILVLVVLSVLRRTSLHERMAATAFVRPALAGPRIGSTGARVRDLIAVAERIVGREAADGAVREYCASVGRPIPRGLEPADRGLMQQMERVLAGAIGASSARLMFTHALQGRGLAAEDIAELLDETSQELRFSRQLLMATMENVAQGISVADNEGRLVAWNGRYLEMFDYPDDLICVGRPVAEIIRWNAERGEFGDTDPEQQIAKRLAHMKAGTAYVIQRQRRNGRVYEMRGQAMPDGGYVTTYTDITEFKRTEQALTEAKLNLEQRVAERTWELSLALHAQESAKLQAEQANATKTRFVAAASHDLLQPLNAARLFASALEEATSDPAVREMAGRIDGSIRAAEEVLDDMLDIARLESGSMRADNIDFSIASVLDGLERQFSPVAARRGLRLKFRPTTARVHGDRVLIRRLLQNLISNALRYTQRGGVLVGCRRRGERVVVEVWDSGPGIADQHRLAIFQEFRRLEQPSPWGEKGLGLGLSICDRIARLLSIELGLRSRPGRGSVFSAGIPAARAAAEAAPRSEVATVASPASLVGCRVLCIDNNEEILAGMAALLSRWDVTVLGAASAEAARRIFETEGPDLVLADYHLGDDDCNGLELLGALRRGERAATGALITADPSAAVAERARELGYPLLRKPVKPAALRALLSALAARRHLAGPPASAR